MSARPKIQCAVCPNKITLRKARRIAPGVYECKGHMDERRRRHMRTDAAKQEARRLAASAIRKQKQAKDFQVVKSGQSIKVVSEFGNVAVLNRKQVQSLEIALIRNQRIKATKQLREISGWGLRESKNFIDKLRQQEARKAAKSRSKIAY